MPLAFQFSSQLEMAWCGKKYKPVGARCLASVRERDDDRYRKQLNAWRARSEPHPLGYPSAESASQEESPSASGWLEPSVVEQVVPLQNPIATVQP